MTLVSGAAALPFATHAQQPAMPVMGYLNAGLPGPAAHMMAVFRQSLAEAGYVEGRNVKVEWRFAEGQYDRLPVLAAELVRSQVAVIVATGGSAAGACGESCDDNDSDIDDPVKIGLVASLARPDGNATGAHLRNPFGRVFRV